MSQGNSPPRDVVYPVAIGRQVTLPSAERWEILILLKQIERIKIKGFAMNKVNLPVGRHKIIKIHLVNESS